MSILGAVPHGPHKYGGGGGAVPTPLHARGHSGQFSHPALMFIVLMLSIRAKNISQAKAEPARLLLPPRPLHAALPRHPWSLKCLAHYGSQSTKTAKKNPEGRLGVP